MFDMRGHQPVASAAVAINAVEFFRIELSPMLDGSIRVSLTATTLDDEEQELLDRDVGSHQVANVDEVLALIRKCIRMPATPPVTFR